jgi:hypothetical protein
MNKEQLITEIDNLNQRLFNITESTGHIGIALQAMAIVKDYLVATSPEAVYNLHSDPFYVYFQTKANDMHTQYPLSKMAVREALEGYKRYLEGKNN